MIRQTAVMEFGEEYHKKEIPSLSHLLGFTVCQNDLSTSCIIINHSVKGVFASFFPTLKQYFFFLFLFYGSKSPS